jgi:hypothetical protein
MSSPAVTERFQIYVNHIGTIVAGGAVFDYPKLVDTEAPFALRGIAVRIAKNLTAGTYSLVNNFDIRWKNASNTYTAKDLLPVPVALRCGTGGFGGIGGHPGVVYPQEIFPAGSSINIDLANARGSTDLDVTVYFWGVKLFPAGHIDAPTYPARCAMLDYTKTFTAFQLGLTENRTNQILKIAADADYVLSAGQGGCNNNFPNFPSTFLPQKNLLLTISDHNVKPYMDAGVDMNYLLGTSQSTFGQGSGFVGNATPGLFVPEIYVRANDLLYLDFNRQDAAFNGQAGAGPVNIQVVFQGRKVYLK